MQPVKQSIREEDEFAFKVPAFPDKSDDSDIGRNLAELYSAIGNKDHYRAIESSFKKLWGLKKED